MFQELVQSTRSTLAERLSSPLLGSFIVSWAIWNWKFLVILVSDVSVSSTFDLAKIHSFPDLGAVFMRGIFFPSATAVAFILLYPYPYRWVLEYTLKQQRRAAEVRQKVQDESLLTHAESQALRAQLVSMDRKHRGVIADLNEEITRLNAALDLSSRPKDSLPAEKPSTSTTLASDPLPAIELQVLEAMDKRGGHLERNDLLALLNGTRIEIEFAIGELERKSLISLRPNIRGNSALITFTQQGRKALLDTRKRPEA